MIRLTVLCFLFFPSILCQGSRSPVETKLTNRNGEPVIFPGPTFRPKWAQYLQDLTSTSTTTQKPLKANFVKADDSEEDEQYCILTASPPDPESQCCGVDASTVDRIVGGDPVLIEQHPWLVHVEYYNKNENRYKKLCGGVLISGRYVLSAAHCFSGDVFKVGSPVNVILGEYDTRNEGRDCVQLKTGATVCTDPPIKVPIEKFVVHPKFLSQNASIYNDIALVRLNKTVEFTKFIRPICLPTSDITSLPRHLRLFATGWGAVADRLIQSARGQAFFTQHDYTYDGVKRHVELPYVDDQTCADTYKFLTRGHVCAGDERGRDACQGDSGGPLVYNDDGIYSVVGLVSTGLKKYACGTEGRPAVYTRVYPYVKWIRDNIKP